MIFVIIPSSIRSKRTWWAGEYSATLNPLQWQWWYCSPETHRIIEDAGRMDSMMTLTSIFRPPLTFANMHEPRAFEIECSQFFMYSKCEYEFEWFNEQQSALSTRTSPFTFGFNILPVWRLCCIFHLCTVKMYWFVEGTAYARLRSIIRFFALLIYTLCSEIRGPTILRERLAPCSQWFQTTKSATLVKCNEFFFVFFPNKTKLFLFSDDQLTSRSNAMKP